MGDFKENLSNAEVPMAWKVSNLGTSSSTTRKSPTNVLEFFSEQGNTGTKTFF
jgi:hypothetical protein